MSVQATFPERAAGGRGDAASRLAEARVLGHGLTSHQVFWLMLTVRLTVSVALLPVAAASRAGRDGWAAVLAGLAPGLAMAWLFAYPAVRFRGEGLAAQARLAFGPHLGPVFVVLYCWGYLHLAALILREYSEAIVTAILPASPMAVIASLIALVTAVAAAQDTPTLGRLGLLLGPVVVASVVVIGGLVSPEIQLGRLQPLFSTGWRGLASGLLVTLAWHAEAFFFPALGPAYFDPVRARRGLMAGLAAADVLGTLVAVLVVSVLTAELAGNTSFPLFEVARLVAIGDFIQRIDAIAVGAWGLGLIMGASLFFHAGAVAFAGLFGLSDHRPLTKPMAAMLVALAMTLAEDVHQLREFSDARVLAPYVAALVAVPGLLWAIAARLRPARGVQPERGPSTVGQRPREPSGA